MKYFEKSLKQRCSVQSPKRAECFGKLIFKEQKLCEVLRLQTINGKTTKG